MTPAADIGRNLIPRVSMRFSLSMENEQAGARRGGRTPLARPKSQARAGTGEYSFSVFSWPTSRIGSLTRLIHTLVMNIHNYSSFCPKQCGASRKMRNHTSLELYNRKKSVSNVRGPRHYLLRSICFSRCLSWKAFCAFCVVPETCGSSNR